MQLRPPVYVYFKQAGEGVHIAKRGRNKGKAAKYQLWKCTLCGGDSNDNVHKVFQGSTGGLFKHLKRYHAAEHERALQASSHAKCLF
ncbi:hypothetical protein CYMTET_48751 [Cymbomonas tetramitiformis]|uniref:Uncharacterized protein n=1 Tax=Cymbomonas tetramitiformis TaxID=36881 RepID=A0AAE0BRL7_9CHLO|nr:hypothetical protein CYMTET_48751 [Cymbomonas tetramitiformis]